MLCLSLGVLCNHALPMVRASTDFTVTFYLDEAKTEEYTHQTVSSGEHAVVPITPLKEGNVFLYWELNGNRFSFKNTPIESDIDLVANWKELEAGVSVAQMYSVKFCVDGVVVNEQFVKKGESATAPSRFSLPAGRVFVSWSGDYSNVSQDILIDAVLADAQYTVEVVGFDGNVVHTFTDIRHGEPLDLTEVIIPEVRGYRVDEDSAFTGEVLHITEDGTVFINYVPSTYTVTFSVNGDEYGSQEVAFGQSASFPLIPEKQGYIFQGWFDEATDRAFDFNTAIESDVQLYAKYEMIENKKYDVTFYFDGVQYGAVQRVEEGKTAIMAGRPTREGYDFLGWFVDGENKTPYDFSTPVTEDLSLNALFKIKGYTVTVISDGEVISIQEVKYGGNATEPEVTAQTGYIFTGFDASFKDIRKDTTINATFRLRTFAVMFIDSMGKKMCATQYIEYGKGAKAPKVKEMEGYTFKGWSEDFDNVVDDMVIIPVLEKIMLTVHYVIDGEERETRSVEYAGYAPNLFPELEEGYLFNGWFTDEECESAYDFATPIKASLTLFGETSVKPVDTYTVTFKIDGAIYAIYSVESGADSPLPPSPTKYGYDFVTWEGDYTNITENVEINAVFTEKEYSVSFSGYDDTEEHSITVKYGSRVTLPDVAPKKEGYTFVRWNWDIDTPVTSDVTITAYFSINIYTVTFMVEGEIYEAQEVSHGSYPAIPHQPSVDGKRFVGWFVDDEAFSFRNGITQDMVVTATFSMAMRSIYYYVDDGLYDEQRCEVGSTIVPLEEPKFDEHTDFSGWSGLPQDMKMPNSSLYVYGYTHTHHQFTMTYYIDDEVYLERTYYDGDAILSLGKPEVGEDIIFIEWTGEVEIMPEENVSVFAVVKHYFMLTYSVDGRVYHEYKLLEGSEVSPLTYEGNIEGVIFHEWIDEPEVMPDHPFTVYASITKLNEYTLTYMIDDNRVFKTFSIYETYPVTPLDETFDASMYGYDGVFNAWLDEVAIMPSHDVTIFPSIRYYRNINYYISDRFYTTVRVLAGSEVKGMGEISGDNFNDFEVFKGWIGEPDIMPDEDVRVDADLQILVLYTIYYYIGSEVYTNCIYYETKPVSPLASPSTEIYGKEFVRWIDEPSTMPSHDVNVYAELRDKTKYSITYYIDDEVYAVVEYYAGERVNGQPAPTGLDEGVQFIGWIGEPDIMPEDNVTVIADLLITEVRDNVFLIERVSSTDTEDVYVLKVCGRVNIAAFIGEITFDQSVYKNIRAEYDEYISAGMIDDVYRFIWTVGDNVTDEMTFITFTFTKEESDTQGAISLDIAEAYAFTLDGEIIPVEFAID